MSTQYTINSFFSQSGDHRDLHSFPTRRSSDLLMGEQDHDQEEEHAQESEEAEHRKPDLVALIGDPDVDRHLVRTGREGVSDRKSTRLNSSHRCISYAVFCLKKKKDKYQQATNT